MSIKTKYSLYSLLLFIYSIMPIVDSISGAFHDKYPVGKIYRLVLFFYMMFLLAKNSRTRFTFVVASFAFFLTVQCIVSTSYLAKSIQDVMKLFIPISAINLFYVLIEKGKIKKTSIFKLLDAWSIFYPMLIIVPGVLGIGVAAYDGIVGWKGLFYAINEISFIMSSLIMYRIWKLKEIINLKNIMILFLDCFCVMLMGTKTGYATIGLFVVFLLVALFRKKEKSSIKKTIFLVFCAIVMVMLAFNKMQELTADIFNRWICQRDVYSHSTIDFLTSHRLRRIEGALNIFFNEKMYYPLIGWGFGGELAGFPNLEMDFLDLLFKTGFLGLLFVCLYYGNLIWKIFKKNIWGLLIIGWSVALSFGAGHVLYYGQSGIMLALNIIFCYLIKESKGELFCYLIKESKGELIRGKLISIVIPVYNVEHYLEKCINSVIKQTYKNIEIILIDDGSTDKSGEICDKYKTQDSRIKVFHKKNGGLSDARNLGINNAKGEFIYLLDSDDWINYNTIEHLYKYYQENDLDIVAGGICKSFQNGKETLYTEMGSEIYNSQEASYDLGIRLKICTMAWNKLYKSSLFKNCLYPLGKINEDEFVTYKLILKANKVGYLDEVTYHYFQRGKSIMSSGSVYKRLDALDAFEERISIYRTLQYNKAIEAAEYFRLIYIDNLVSCKSLSNEMKTYVLEVLNKKNNDLLKYDYWHLPVKKQLKAILRIIRIKIRINCMEIRK